MTSRPVRHSFAAFADEWGRHPHHLWPMKHYAVTNLVWISLNLYQQPHSRKGMLGDTRPHRPALAPNRRPSTSASLCPCENLNEYHAFPEMVETAR
jgi:hypothetical protein